MAVATARESAMRESAMTCRMVRIRRSCASLLAVAVPMQQQAAAVFHQTVSKLYRIIHATDAAGRPRAGRRLDNSLDVVSRDPRTCRKTRGTPRKALASPAPFSKAADPEAERDQAGGMGRTATEQARPRGPRAAMAPRLATGVRPAGMTAPSVSQRAGVGPCGPPATSQRSIAGRCCVPAAHGHPVRPPDHGKDAS